MLCQVKDNVEATIEAGGSQRSGVGESGVIHVGTSLHESLHYIYVTRPWGTVFDWLVLENLYCAYYNSI